MEHINNNLTFNTEAPPLQVLIPACRSVRQPEADYVWLHGYSLLTMRVGINAIQLDGEVKIGHRFAENTELVSSLADALDPAAVIVGVDLTSMVSTLGRLPIDADDPAPALAVLSKMRSMLEGHEPIDLGITDQTMNLVYAERLFIEFTVDPDQIDPDGNRSDHADVDSCNPRLLAEYLADEAGACLFSLGQIILTEAQHGQLATAWRNWRQHLIPSLPPEETPAETHA